VNEAALADAAWLRHELGAGYALAYGSHAQHTAGPDSDLDLVFIGDQPLPEAELHALITAVTALHHRHGLVLDEEVAFASKLRCTTAQVDQATALGGFAAAEPTQLTVTAVVAEPWWLNSPEFRLRLILNALTTPHVFLGGDLTAYRRHTQDAETGVALLALALLDQGRFRIADAVAVLLEGPEGARGQDWLGYQPGPHLLSLLHRGMAALAERGIVGVLDGGHLAQDRALRRAAVARLHGRLDAAGARPCG
jgi:hypothetical protein